MAKKSTKNAKTDDEVLLGSAVSACRNSTLGQLMRYAVVGGLAFLVDYGMLWVLTEYVHLHYLTSAALAFVLGLAVNYVLSARWVFTESRFQSVWLEFGLFALIGIVGLGLNELLIYVVADVMGLHYMVGKLTSTVVVFLWNFFARKFMLFHK